MPDHFVMLEVRDVELVAFVHRTRQILGFKNYSAPVHITVQGPFPEPVDGARLKRYRDKFSDDPLVVTGVGSFESPLSVVFLRVHHPQLRAVWNKPDFPVERFGFNPHVTLWEGDDSLLREKLVKFLSAELLAFYCLDFRFVQYTSKQPDLFDDRIPYISEKRFGLYRRGKLERSFYTRLLELITMHGIRN